jgi:hypothetical protein
MLNLNKIQLKGAEPDLAVSLVEAQPMPNYITSPYSHDLVHRVERYVSYQYGFV